MDVCNALYGFYFSFKRRLLSFFVSRSHTHTHNFDEWPWISLIDAPMFSNDANDAVYSTLCVLFTHV